VKLAKAAHLNPAPYLVGPSGFLLYPGRVEARHRQPSLTHFSLMAVRVG